MNPHKKYYDYLEQQKKQKATYHKEAITASFPESTSDELSREWYALHQAQEMFQKLFERELK